MSHGRTRISMPAILMQTCRVLATFTSQMFSGPPCVCVYTQSLKKQPSFYFKNEEAEERRFQKFSQKSRIFPLDDFRHHKQGNGKLSPSKTKAPTTTIRVALGNSHAYGRILLLYRAKLWVPFIKGHAYILFLVFLTLLVIAHVSFTTIFTYNWFFLNQHLSQKLHLLYPPLKNRLTEID